MSLHYCRSICHTSQHRNWLSECHMCDGHLAAAMPASRSAIVFFRQSCLIAVQALSEAFAAGDLESALDMTVRLKYTERIREAIEKRAGA